MVEPSPPGSLLHLGKCLRSIAGSGGRGCISRSGGGCGCISRSGGGRGSISRSGGGRGSML